MEKIIQKSDYVSSLLKNFANKDKLAILCYLGNEEKNVSNILKCSKISQSQVSQFLNKMKLEGILESDKVGKEVFYKIKNKEILNIISCLKNIFN